MRLSNWCCCCCCLLLLLLFLVVVAAFCYCCSSSTVVVAAAAAVKNGVAVCRFHGHNSGEWKSLSLVPHVNYLTIILKKYSIYKCFHMQKCLRYHDVLL